MNSVELNIFIFFRLYIALRESGEMKNVFYQFYLISVVSHLLLNILMQFTYYLFISAASDDVCASKTLNLDQKVDFNRCNINYKCKCMFYNESVNTF